MIESTRSFRDTTMAKSDWRKKIHDSMEKRVDRLMKIEASDDDKAAMDAIKVLLELSGELQDTPANPADAAPLFALPADAQPAILPKKPRKDLH